MATYGLDDELPQSDNRPCSKIRDDLIKCLKESDCMLKEKKMAKDCLMHQYDSVPAECYSLRRLLFECKRSLLDNRMRFRGHKGY